MIGYEQFLIVNSENLQKRNEARTKEKFQSKKIKKLSKTCQLKLLVQARTGQDTQYEIKTLLFALDVKNQLSSKDWPIGILKYYKKNLKPNYLAKPYLDLANSNILDFVQKRIRVFKELRMLGQSIYAYQSLICQQENKIIFIDEISFHQNQQKSKQWMLRNQLKTENIISLQEQQLQLVLLALIDFWVFRQSKHFLQQLNHEIRQYLHKKKIVITL